LDWNEITYDSLLNLRAIEYLNNPDTDATNYQDPGDDDPLIRLTRQVAERYQEFLANGETRDEGVTVTVIRMNGTTDASEEVVLIP
jgi:hypothetical protein